MAQYQSEFTQFMNDFLQKNPQIAADQQKYRLTWWDKKVDLDDQKRWQESRVKNRPYAYQPD